MNGVAMPPMTPPTMTMSIGGMLPHSQRRDQQSRNG
jgi:hypothetical protein